jgi:hypothetical protein
MEVCEALTLTRLSCKKIIELSLRTNGLKCSLRVAKIGGVFVKRFFNFDMHLRLYLTQHAFAIIKNYYDIHCGVLEMQLL